RSFFKKSIGVATALSIGDFLAFEALGADSVRKTSHFSYDPDSFMKAGFAEADITPQIGMEQPGNYGKSYHQSFHDACKIRAAVFNEGNQKVVLVGIDALAIYQPLVDSVRKRV